MQYLEKLVDEFRGYEIRFEDVQGRESCIKIEPTKRIRGESVLFEPEIFIFAILL